MSIDQELLDILVCPETKDPVTRAASDVLDRLNASIARGTVVTRGGEAVKDAVAEGLIRADGRVLYPVRDGIPIMLIDESIDLEAL